MREKALRLIFQQGFFKVRQDTLRFSRQPDIVHLPYWLGFYAHGEIVRCRVMDAVRRRIEGAKASAFSLNTGWPPDSHKESKDVFGMTELPRRNSMLTLLCGVPVLFLALFSLRG